MDAAVLIWCGHVSLSHSAHSPWHVFLNRWHADFTSSERNSFYKNILAAKEKRHAEWNVKNKCIFLLIIYNSTFEEIIFCSHFTSLSFSVLRTHVHWDKPVLHKIYSFRGSLIPRILNWHLKTQFLRRNNILEAWNSAKMLETKTWKM